MLCVIRIRHILIGACVLACMGVEHAGLIVHHGVSFQRFDLFVGRTSDIINYIRLDTSAFYTLFNDLTREILGANKILDSI